jgi:acetaldehyde dehydrogenase
MGTKTKVAILGSGNIGTDLMYKLLKDDSSDLELGLFVGIDADSDGLRRANDLGIPTSHHGIQAILEDSSLKIVFDATSAKAHVRHAKLLEEAGRIVVDLTPAARGPYVVPPVNLGAHLDAPNVNLITCGGQATIPMVYAISQITPVSYAEMVSTVASKSAGPGTRQNIDEFTWNTAKGLEVIGGARRGKAIIILNPAEPPILMRNTIYIVPEEKEFDENAITKSLEAMEAKVAQYVPGYRMKNAPVFETRDTPLGARRVVIVMLEVKGAGDYLPKYAGNLDIMTAAAKRVGEVLATNLVTRRAVSV